MKIGKRIFDWYYGNNDKEKEPPKTGLRRIGYILVNYIGALLMINIIFILSCIPIITIPSAVTALNRYLGKIFRDGYGYALSDYFKELKSGFKKSLVPGALVGALLFYAYYLLSLSGNYADHITSSLMTGLGIGVLIFAVLIGAYVFVLSSMVELPVKYLLKNTIILMFVEWKASILVVLCTFLIGFLCFALVPYSILFLLLIVFSVMQLLTISILTPVILRRVITPYRDSRAK